LYENLPEEGGKKGTTGGKQEESVLKAIKQMIDVICLHLSDELFHLVLKLVYEYATTNAKSNAVRAFGQLVACLARVRPDQTIARFLPFCVSQIQEELKHGASSVRTTSTHAAVPSDTTLHWSGCLLLMIAVKLIDYIPTRFVHSSGMSRIWWCSGTISLCYEDYMVLIIDSSASEI
jgi:proteasome activator subunit 4